MQEFSGTLVKWYRVHKRDLPWRNSRDPYLIWLSEIILQQTRVDQGLPYYLRFSERFPTVHHLAKAKEAEVMKLWQGLGYYSRARNLHATAQFISSSLHGKFPDTYAEILKLKGVGQYTAGAIASFAFGEAQPVVDGNVYRVLSRYFGIRTPIDSGKGKKEFYTLAKELLDHRDPGTHNQAIMEFGARQCLPQKPLCDSCPLQNSCYARAKKKISLLPVKEKKLKVSDRYLHYFVIRSKGTILLNHRSGNDIWKGLYDFPHLESDKAIRPEKLLSSTAFRAIIGNAKFHVKNISPVYKHVLSHQHIRATFIEMEMHAAVKNNTYLPVKEKALGRYAIPRLIERYLEDVR